MELFEGQIFVLLGHNGAGKTTTISMLSGLAAPSSGGGTVFGLSITNSMDAIRHKLGVCPQKNVLFDDLTVRDHLDMFARLKGVAADRIDSMIEEVITDVGLSAKLNELPCNLSGGQKRKCCLAIAMMGDNAFLVLDEPTSGMDVFAQRSTWNLLQRVKRGKIVLLTTHSMEEADILGDKIGIMAQGKMVCCGSPLFLKQRYGAGYTIVVTRADGRGAESAVEDLVLRHVSQASVVSDIGKEISFSAPLSSAHKFEALFADLDRAITATRSSAAAGGIESYGVSVTTMEEVFLKSALESERVVARQMSAVASGEESGAAASAAASLDVLDDAEVSAPTEHRASGGRTTCIFATHFAALFIKRARYAIRDWKAAALQICIPLVALAVGLSVIKFNVPQDGPVLVLDASSQFNVLASGGTVLPYGGVPLEASALAAQVGWGATPLAASGGAAWNPNGLYGHCATLCGPKYAKVACDSASGDFDPSNAANVTAAQLGMDQYLMAHARERAASTYGAFRLGAATSAEMNAWELELWQNSTAAHGAPIVLHIVADALLRVANGGAQASASIKTNFRPLSLTQTQASQSAETSTFTSALIIVMAFAFIPVSFATFIVRERQLEVKHQQLISGVSITAYWTSSYAFDIVAYMVPCLGSIAMIAAFQISGWTEAETFAALCLLFLFYGISVAPFT